MKIIATEKTSIEDGVHQGAIIGVDYREKPYEYTDIIIEFAVGDNSLRLKAGYPTKNSEETALGKLMIRFGFPIQVGKPYDPDELVGKAVKFLTTTEETKNGTFARVLPESVKPL